MNIIGIMPATGGIGATTTSIKLASVLKNTLLIDFNNGFRTIDILINETDIIYDIYDFTYNIDNNLVIKNTNNFDFIAASQSKDIEDFNLDNLKEKLLSLDYEIIIIDLPRNSQYIKKISYMLTELIMISDFEDTSKRNLEKIIYESFKNNRNIKLGIILNKIQNLDIKEITEFSDNLKIAKLLEIIEFKEEFSEFYDDDFNNLNRFINDEEIKSKDLNRLSTDSKIRKDKNEKRTWIQKFFGN